MNAATTRFGRFVLDVAQRRLLADGEAVTLGSRAFEVLQILVEQATAGGGQGRSCSISSGQGW